jgi:endo-1,4-beta-mannosidase
MMPTEFTYRCAAFKLALLCSLFGSSSALSQDEHSSPRLGIERGRFTVNGKPSFLLGMSYYGALGASEDFVRRDLADMRRHGINWIRVWATWAAFDNDVSAVDQQGGPRQSFLDKLRRLVKECGRHGMIVDVTLSRGNGMVGPPRLQSLEAHRRAVETIVTALKAEPNWCLDLANERDVRDKRYVGIEILTELRSLVKKLDPGRLVTASHGSDLSRQQMREDLETIGVDFVCPHRPRTPDSPGQTEAKTREYLQWMQQIGRSAPLHYQEPFPRGYTKWQPRVEDFLTDLRGAKTGGAAGWCFHNTAQREGEEQRPRRSFDLRERRLFDQFDDEERKVLSALKD